MRITTLSLLALSACMSGPITVTNETAFDVDLAQVLMMADRVCPWCSGPLDVHLVDSTDTGTSEYVYGGGHTPQINALFRGDLVGAGERHCGLAHELIHWRLHELTGDSDPDHGELDWYLIDNIETEFRRDAQ